MFNGAVWTALFFATIAHVGQALVCDDETTATTDHNPFVTLKNVIFFGGCDGINTLGQFLLFMLFTMPVLLIVAAYTFQMFGSELGAAIAIVIGLITAGLGFFA